MTERVPVDWPRLGICLGVTMAKSRALIAIGVAVGLSCTPRGDQLPGEVGDLHVGSNVLCPSCAIVLDTVTTLEHVFMSGAQRAIARSPSGTLYVLDRTDGLLRAFGGDGRYLMTVGRKGGGPGEYENIRNVMVGRDGSVHVLDGMLGRHTVFGENGSYVRSHTVPIGAGLGQPAVLRTDGAIAVNAVAITGAADSVNTVHLVDSLGNRIIALDNAPFGPSTQWRQWRHLWLRENDWLLVARPYSLRIDVYDAGMTRQRTITRVAEWFPTSEPDHEPSAGIFDEPYTPRLDAIWEDETGLLWLAMSVPARDWTPSARRPRPGHPEYAELAGRPRAEVVVEVLDLERQTVLAHARFKRFLGVDFGGGFFARPVENAIGEPSVLILHARLQQ